MFVDMLYSNIHGIMLKNATQSVNSGQSFGDVVFELFTTFIIFKYTIFIVLPAEIRTNYFVLSQIEQLHHKNTN